MKFPNTHLFLLKKKGTVMHKSATSIKNALDRKEDLISWAPLYEFLENVTRMKLLRKRKQDSLSSRPIKVAKYNS